MARSLAKDKIIDTAMDLMLHQGYPGTTVDEICDRAGVSKGSFYHSFNSKEEMGLAVLAEFFRIGSDKLMAGPWADLEDPVARAFGFVEYTQSIAAAHWRRGCLLATFALDIGEMESPIRHEVRRLFEVMEENLEQIFAPFGGQDGAIGRPTSREIGHHFLVVLEGSILLARAYGDPEIIVSSLAPFRSYLERLAP